MLQLTENLEKIKPSYVIVTDQNRLSRGNDFWYIKGLMSKSKTALITEFGGVLDFSNDPVLDLVSDVSVSAAKFERKQIGCRVSRGIIQKGLEENYIGKPS